VARGVLVVNAMEINGKLLINCVIEEAFYPNPGRPQYLLNCSANDPEFAKLRLNPAQVRPAGEKLYGALVSDKAGVEFFAQRLAVPAPAPIYIDIERPDVEELPWEVLCEEKKNFMALDPEGRWPIARLASASKRAEPLNRFIGNELRMAMVLAAAGENGTAEWSSISGALGAFKTPVDVLGLVSEEASKTAMTADATQWAGQAPARNVEIEFVGDGTSLMARLRAHVPNIIHFFCHGVADVRPLLELESRTDRTAKPPKNRGSIKLDSDLLKQLTSLKSLWLVVLNCCQGGKSAPHLHSLARDLVAGGVPAVVAMRESVDVNDANLFAEYFYPALFAQLQGIFNLKNMPGGPKPLPLDELIWVRAVDIARRQLSVPPREPDSSAEWTYPVVYVHRDELKLHPRDLKVAVLTPEQRLALLGELGTLRTFRSAFEGATDAELAERNKFDAQIAQLEAQLEGL